MTLRTRHGKAARYGTTPVLETLPVDELPEGLPDDARQEQPGDRGAGGRFAPGNGLAVRGGRAKGGKSRLAQRLGLAELPPASPFKPYKASAETFRRVTCTAIASTIGGGFCGPIPSSMVNSAALALAWSRYWLDAAALIAESDVTRASKLVEQGTKLAEASSSLVRQAHEYAAKEAVARQKRAAAGHDPHRALETALAEST